ncbi:12994_t:CDS:10, partial [Rhizophagus irregularis]
MTSPNLRRGRKKKTDNTTSIVDKPTSESPLSLRDMFNKSSTKKSSRLSTTRNSNVITKKQKDGVVSTQTSTSQNTIPQNLPLPYIQLPDVEVNLTNTKKPIQRSNEQLELHNPIEFNTGSTHVSSAKPSARITESRSVSDKSQHQSTRFVLSESVKGISNSLLPSSTSEAIKSGISSIKRKKPEESGQNNLLTKHFKLNSSIQSTLEKVLEEQLAQRITIDNLQKRPTMMTQQTKQYLKRRDTKHMWWDAPMTTACHKLFQVNKNPSDTEVEQAFKLQVQADFPQKMQELVNSNEWNNLWKAMHSIMLEYFRNHRSFYVRKIKDAIYNIFNLFSYKLDQFASPTEIVQWKKSERIIKARHDLWKKIDDSDQKSPCIIEVILQRAFNKEELQNENNVKFVQERMNQWDSNPIVQKWLEGKEPSENNTINCADNDEQENDNIENTDSDK